MNSRSRMLTAVVVLTVLAAAAGFLLTARAGLEVAAVRALVDIGLLAALAGAVLAVTRSPEDKREELLDAMRALARGVRERRLDPETFGDLDEVARTYNELAVSLTEHEDPNLGPVRAKRRGPRPPWMSSEGESGHPELGEVRVVRPKKQPEREESHPPEEPAAKPAKPTEPPRSAPPEQAKADDDGELALQAPPEAKPAPSEPPQAAEPALSQQPAPTEDDDNESEAPAEVPSNDTAIDEAPAAADEPAPAPAAELAPTQSLEDLGVLFKEFLEAKRAHDEDIDDLELDSFAETIQEESERLREAHGCRAVRFEVRVQDGEVSLLPRLIR